MGIVDWRSKWLCFTFKFSKMLIHRLKPEFRIVAIDNELGQQMEDAEA
jgi:hypothetical protein